MGEFYVDLVQGREQLALDSADDCNCNCNCYGGCNCYCNCNCECFVEVECPGGGCY